MRQSLCALLGSLLLVARGTGAVELDWVVVGAPGNPPDDEVMWCCFAMTGTSGGTDFDGGESILGAGQGDPAGPDPQCLDRPWRNGESAQGCGLGAELAPVLLGLAWRLRARAS